MCESLSYSLSFTESSAILVVIVPELDIEHEDSVVLQVHSRELVFTAPPYHARIPVPHNLMTVEVFPMHIDYEKCSVTYHIPLSVQKMPTSELAQQSFHYGFNNFYIGALSIQNSQDIKVLSNPNEFSNDERRKKRLMDEQNDFNSDYYGMDHMQYTIDGFGLESVDIPLEVRLTEGQNERINAILNERKSDLEKFNGLHNVESVVISLLDITLAVLYDKLTNHNEQNEAISFVNIHRLSATLSYFEQLDTVEEVLYAFYRRCCTYPLFRSKHLARKCALILTDALQQENFTEWILEKLMYCYDAFNGNDCVILNHYFIRDFVKFVKFCEPLEAIRQIGNKIPELLPKIHDKSLGFDEELVVKRIINDVIGVNEESTDSDDVSDDDTESGNSSSNESVIENSDEGVLNKLLNLKIHM